MPLKIMLGLILCNAVWATNPIMGKFLMHDFSPLQVAWLRYSGSLAFYIFLVLFWKPSKKTDAVQGSWRELGKKSVLPWILILAVCSFFLSPYFQYRGLATSTAMANSLIVAMEPLFAVVIAWLVLREKIHWQQLGALFLAIGGFALLSNINPTEFLQSLQLFNTGNLLILFAIIAEAAYSSWAKPLLPFLSPLQIFGYALCIGWCIFTPYLFFTEGLPDLRSLNIHQWLSILLMGPIGTTATYVYWTIALKDVSVAAAAVTLFIQPIQGTILGFILMNERLSLLQVAGAAIILIALLLQTVSRKEPYGH